ncbi:MAG: ATP-binding cassette domain-containing protein [Christensenellales bacterium]
MEPLIVLNNYSLKYKDTDILKDVNVSFYPGKVYLIDGENGVGKSSFIKSLLGFERDLKKQDGVILINGSNNVLEMNDREIQILRSKVAYLEQKDDYSYSVSVLDVLKDSYQAFVNRTLNKKDIEYIVNIFNEYGKELNFGLKNKVNKLSGGQQRILSILASICIRKESKVFILDEPLNNLDLKNVVKISNILNKIVKSRVDAVFIIVTHCKIFPFVTDVLRIENKKLVKLDNKIECYACFGKHDENGYY